MSHKINKNENSFAPVLGLRLKQTNTSEIVTDEKIKYNEKEEMLFKKKIIEIKIKYQKL